MMEHYSEYFYGHKISDCGLEHGYVDYRTLAKAFEAVLNNGIIENTSEIGYWEQVSGFVDNSEEIEELQEQIEELEAIKDRLEDEEPEADNTDEYIAEFKKWEESVEELENKIAELQDKIAELEEEQDSMYEIYQYYIVSDNGAEILRECNEIVFYNEVLDMYVWGVTHYGTAWDYVLTDIRLVLDE